MKRLAIWMAGAAAIMAVLAEAATYQLALESLACPLQSYNVECELSKIAGIADIAIDFRTGIAVVTTKDGVALDRETADR